MNTTHSCTWYRHVSGLSVGLIILMSHAHASAQEATRTTLRTFIPIMSVELGTKADPGRGVDRPGRFVLWGFEGSHALRSGVTLEASYASIRNVEGNGRVMGLRGGYTFNLRETKRKTSTRSTHLIPFAGYRHVNLPEGHRDGYFHTHLAHNAHLGLGYAIERKTKFNIVLRFNAGMDFALWSRFRPHVEVMATQGDKLRRVSFFNVSMGMAFYDLLGRTKSQNDYWSSTPDASQK